MEKLLGKLHKNFPIQRRDFLKYTGNFVGSYLIDKLLFNSNLKALTVQPHPRVISVHDSNATNWDHRTGYHWQYIDQSVVDNMVAIGIKSLACQSDLIDAWNVLIPYQAGESVAIKVNCNNSSGCNGAYDNAMDAYPEVVNAVIDGLISIGVPADKIWITDPSRGIPLRFIDGIKNSEVQYYGAKKTFFNCSPNSHETSYVAINSPECSPTTHPPGDIVRPAQVLVDAVHLINIPLLKGHGVRHMTLSMKNHYGSVTFSGSDPASERHRMHQYLQPHINPDREKSILADVCNNPHIKNKTRLVIGDGLFGHPIINWEKGGAIRWQSFNDDDPNILFFGTDFVATDSVMLDYIQEEQYCLGYGDIIHSSLHHGAAINLGVHDHWDSFESKQYFLIDYVNLDLDNGDDISLPVELSSFYATIWQKHILLKWTTESELNNLGFIITRSTSTEGSFREIASYHRDKILRGQGNTADKTNYTYTDKSVLNNCKYYYKLTSVDFDGQKTIYGPVHCSLSNEEMQVATNDKIPQIYALYQNHPNPFNSSTKITYSIPQPEKVSVEIYNSLGRGIKTLLNRQMPSGNHEIIFNAQDLPSGIYFYRIQVGAFNDVKKMALLR